MLPFIVGLWGILTLLCLAHRQAKMADLRADTEAAQRDFERAVKEFDAAISELPRQ